MQFDNQTIRAKAGELRKRRAILEGKKELLGEQRAAIELRFASQGINPSDLPQAISELEALIQQKQAEFEELARRANDVLQRCQV